MRIKNDFIFEDCFFDGPPPKGFIAWSTWAEHAIKNRKITGVKFVALDPSFDDELLENPNELQESE